MILTMKMPCFPCLLSVALFLWMPVSDWARLEKSVRDQTIRKEDAKKQFLIVYKSLKDLCGSHPFERRASWHFPVQGYGIRDVGAGGFKPSGYDLYDGNRHGGHPACDIFIRDKNQDSLDDRTGRPVMIVAPVDLLVLSAESDWESGSKIRGGRYVWALDPLHDRIFYFAHLNAVHVSAGAFCKAGSVIGTVGRTGKNALPARSPTHLHFMVLEVKGSALIPFNTIRLLQ